MNKRVFLFLLLLLGRLGDTLSPLQAQPSRKKVAVVLSGGGAKGVAHVKALKVIEEAGIPVDYIVGTSMGAIVGGLYAIGYTPNQLDSLVRKQDWSFILSDRIRRRDMSLTEREQSDRYILSLPFVRKKQTEVFGGMIQGQNLSNLFSELTMGYHDSIDFNRLPIPFACVATNIVDGREIVFHNGELGTAMRASMAIPGVFTPVR
ncbi:MAG: patatin-like phospholipase family protein, partial [Bacteroides sp.]